MSSHYQRVKSYLELGLIVLWVLSGGGVYYVLARNVATAALFLYTAALFIIYRPKIKNVLLNYSIYILLLIIFCLWLCFIRGAPPQDPTKYLYILIAFIISGAICIYFFASFTYTEFITLFYKGLNLIRIHAILSALFMPFLIRYSTIVDNDYGFNAYSFKYLFFMRSDQYAFNLLGLSFYRNQSLFWEPGVLQFYLNLFLFLQLYIFKVSRKTIFLTVFAIIVTYSTTAYACMLLILSVYILNLVRKKPLTAILGSFAILAITPLFVANLQNKFQGNNQTSALVRLYDITEQMLVIEDYFLTGVGLDDGTYAEVRTHYRLSGDLSNLIDFNGAERGSTNSIMFVLGTLGVFMGGWWIISYTKQQFIRGQKLVLTIFLLISVSTEPLLLKPFFMTLIISGMIFTFVRFKYPQIKSLWKSEEY
jgi:hypothetical protein